MTAARTARRLGACYPRAWCERYGEELEELIVLAAGGGSVDWNTRLDVLRGAARERARCALGLGPGGGPHERSREGVAAVLCAWAVFAVAGSVVAKTSEHWNEVMLGRVPVIATLGFDALRIAAVVTAAFVVVGMLVALPAALELLRREGLAAHRRPLARAAGFAAAALGATAGLVAWADHVSPSARAGHDVLYVTGFLVWAALGAAALLACTLAALDIQRRLRPLGPRTRRTQSALAAGATLGMAVMTAGTLAWWSAVSLRAPGALVGSPVQVQGSPWVPQLIAAALLMTGATVIATAGARRALTAR
jgi:hypothetical protein